MSDDIQCRACDDSAIESDFYGLDWRTHGQIMDHVARCGRPATHVIRSPPTDSDLEAGRREHFYVVCLQHGLRDVGRRPGRRLVPIETCYEEDPALRPHEHVWKETRLTEYGGYPGAGDGVPDGEPADYSLERCTVCGNERAGHWLHRRASSLSDLRSRLSNSPTE